ncbi:MAG: ATP-binding protein [Armatimonadota bacterium]
MTLIQDQQPANTIQTKRQPASGLQRLAWVPVLLLLTAVIVLRVANPPGAYESLGLLVVLNLLFQVLVSFFVAYLVGGSFLAGKTPGLLLLGCGVLLWGFAGAVGSISGLIGGPPTTIHNTCVWFSAMCHLAGVIVSLRTGRTVRAPGLWLVLAYALSLGAVVMVTLLALSGRMPAFFVPSQGSTLVRCFVLGSAIAMFGLTALLLIPARRKPLSPFAYWYGLSLALMAVGLFGVLLQSSQGSLLNWTGRGALLLSGVYMLVAAIAMRGPGAEVLRPETGPYAMRYQYGLAVVMVIAATALRLLFLPSLEMHAPYVVFYPAVMLAALYGGLRAGLLASGLSAFVGSYFWFEPAARFDYRSPAHWLAMVILFLGGAMVSAVTEAMHRARARAHAAETEARVAAARQRDLEALRGSEERLRLALQAGGMGTWDWHVPSDESIWNDTHYRMFGYEPGTVVPSYRLWVDGVHPDDRAYVESVLQRAMEQGSDYSAEYRVVWPDGTLRWIEVRGRFERDAAGQPIRSYGVALDTTEHKEADRAKDEFFAVLSHELQTPLTNMLGWSSEALRRAEPEFMAGAMEIVHRNALRQKRLVQEILDMSRLIHRKLELKCEPLDLREQTEQAMENIQQEAAERRLTLVMTPCPEPLPVFADTFRLQQCIGNLLHNSLKFTPAGGAITLACSRDGVQAVLTVTDTGRGIAPEALPAVFQVFRQVDRDERAGGLGLGLSITRNLIELHGGRIRADSPGIDRGSTFTIALPIADGSG